MKVKEILILTIIGLIDLSLATLLGIAFGSFIGGLIFFILLPAFGFSLIYKVLAPLNTIWTFVPEGYGKIITKGESFHKCIINWKGHIINPETWDIEEGESPKRIWGGLYLVGIPPIYKVYKYHFRWANLLENGKVKEYDETLDRIRLMLNMYVIRFPREEQAEDIHGLPLALDFVLPVEIKNPYIALFKVAGWLRILTGTIKPIVRSFVAKYRYREDLLSMEAGERIEIVQREVGVAEEVKPGDDLREKLWESIIKKLKVTPEDESVTIYGVKIFKRGLDIINIDPGPSYRKWTTRRYESMQKKEAAEFEAEEDALKTSGFLIKQLARITGESEDTIQAEIKRDPDLRKKFTESAVRLTHEKVAIDGNAFLRIAVDGAEGDSLKKAILEILGLINLASKRKEDVFSKRITNSQEAEEFMRALAKEQGIDYDAIKKEVEEEFKQIYGELEEYEEEEEEEEEEEF